MKLPKAYKSKAGIICPQCAEDMECNETAALSDHTPLYKVTGKCSMCENTFDMPPTKLVHTNPLVHTVSITRLISYLNLPRKRVIELLNNDQIIIDHGEIEILVVGGSNKYKMNKVLA